jgi:hypothetical protein
MAAGGLDGKGLAAKTYTVAATIITIRAASMAAGAAEPLLLLRLLSRITLAPVASRA